MLIHVVYRQINLNLNFNNYIKAKSETQGFTWPGGDFHQVCNNLNGQKKI